MALFSSLLPFSSTLFSSFSFYMIIIVCIVRSLWYLDQLTFTGKNVLKVFFVVDSPNINKHSSSYSSDDSRASENSDLFFKSVSLIKISIKMSLFGCVICAEVYDTTESKGKFPVILRKCGHVFHSVSNSSELCDDSYSCFMFSF